LDGVALPRSPYIDFSASDQQVMEHLDDYGRRYDRIWQSVGGCTREHFGPLAIWAIRNREHIGVGSRGLAMACAALVYGESKLGRDWMKDYEEHWQQRVLAEPNDSGTRSIYEHVKEDLVRLVAAIGH